METELYKQHKVLRHLQRQLFKNGTLIKKNQKCRCLVVLHLFYDSSWIEINEYLKNLAPYRFDLIVTATQDRIRQETYDQIKKEYPDAQITILENKGYDLLPFFLSIKDIDLNKYDVVFKLHSKSTKRRFVYIYRQFFLRRDWFLNLYEGILSARNVHKTIDSLFNQPETGIVASSNLIVKDPVYKANIIKKMQKEYGFPFFDDYSFVAGTCFAIKAVCLKPIQNMHFENADYSPLVPSRGMSFAHFLERYICSSVLLQGYTIKGNSATLINRMILKPISYILNVFSSERLYKEDLEFDDEWFFWQMDNKPIFYKYDYVKFNELTWNLANRISSVIDGAPYKYIVNGDISEYEEYCRIHKASNLPLMTKERYDRLIESILNNGYDERKIVIVDNKNTILDGQHRACVLASLNGVDTRIKVLRIWDIKKIIRKLLIH